MAINGVEVLLGNLGLITNKGDITEKYRTIAQYIGLVQEGSSHYNYFIPTEQDIVFMLRLSNHNNENEALYNLHEKKGRPDIRYIIFFQGNGYTPLFNGTFCEARHYAYNYPISGLDSEEDVVKFLSSLQELFTKGQTIFRGVMEEPRLSNDDIISQWNRTIDRNNETNESKNMKKNVVKINENTLRQIVAESVKKVLKEGTPLWGNEVHPSPYQDIIDKLTPIYRELNGKFGGINGIGDGVEFSQAEANQLDAANHILKAMDLLRYPKMKRDS